MAPHFEIDDQTRDELRPKFPGLIAEEDKQFTSYQQMVGLLSDRTESGLEWAVALKYAAKDNGALLKARRASYADLKPREAFGVRQFDVSLADVLGGKSPTFSVPTSVDEKRRHPIVGFSVFYRAWWLVLSIGALIWGAVVGASAVGPALVGPVTAVVGTVVLLGLLVTLFIAGRQTDRLDE
ncbi:hypothetical protein [Microbacterium sp.]